MSYDFLANQIFLSDSGKSVVIKHRIYALLLHHVFKQLWKPGSSFLQGSWGTQLAYAKEGEQEHHLISFSYCQGTPKMHSFISIGQEAASYSCSLASTPQSWMCLSALMKAKSKEGTHGAVSKRTNKRCAVAHTAKVARQKYSLMDKANKGRNMIFFSLVLVVSKGVTGHPISCTC